MNVLNFGKILFKFANFSKCFQYFLSFSEFNDHYWPKNFETKKGFDFFFAKLRICFNFSFFSVIFYMVYLLTRLKN